MVKIYIDNEMDCTSYDMDECFDMDTVAIFGNRDYMDYLPEWFEKAKAIMEHLDTFDYVGEWLRDDYPELSREQRKALVKLYDEILYTDDKSTITAVLNIIYPEKKYVSGTIRGCEQREWMDIIYDESASDSIQLLSDYYFGYVKEIQMEDGEESTWAIISDTELFEHRNELKAFLLDFFDYSKDTECRIFESDGYIRTKKWKEVEQPEKSHTNPFVEVINAAVDTLANYKPEPVNA